MPKNYIFALLMSPLPARCKCGGVSKKVWCDMETDGGGWTVFLKRQRQTNQLNFSRIWEEYKTGFGDPYEEYFMGAYG